VEGKMEKVITLDFDTFDDTCVLKYYVYFNEVSEVAHRSWDMVVDKTYYERFPEIKK
jgi:hypothetical protein